MTGDRDDLVRLLQDYAGEADGLSQVFAERHGMHVTDLSALLAIMHADRAGVPLTPGRLGAWLRLSSGATTAVIDRLERAAHVQRSRDTRDRRRVTLRLGAAAHQVGAAFFGPLGMRIDAMLADFTADEQATVRRFLAATTALVREHREGLPEAVPQEAVPREAVPREAVPREAVPREAVPREAVPREAVPREDGPGVSRVG